MAERLNDPPGLQACFNTELGDFLLDVALQLPNQGVSVIFGPSGCGKTSLLRCIAGLDHADGELHVNGSCWQQPGHNLPVHQRPLAYVFQEASLFPHLSVQRNLEYGYRRVAPEQRRIQFDQVVQWLGLEPLLQRMPHKLSGGERQRVAIGRALLTSPQLLLMDEPLSALDQASKREILPYLERLHQSLSIPVLYVTHSLEEVSRLADQLVVMDQGQILASGPLNEMLARLDLPIRQEEDAGVVIDAKIAERDNRWHLARAEFNGGSLWVKDQGLKLGTPVRLRVLARDISLANERFEQQSIQNLLAARITDISHNSHPAVGLVRVETQGTPLLARLTLRSIDELKLQPGKPVWVQVKTAAVLD